MIHVNYNSGPIAHSPAMCKEKLSLDQEGVRRQPSTALTQDVETSIPRQCEANRIDEVVAAVADGMRVTSAKTTELMKHSRKTVCQTRNMIASSREAIARSRALLANPVDLPCTVGSRYIADVNESAGRDRE